VSGVLANNRYKPTPKSCPTRAGRLKSATARAMSSNSRPKDGITWPMMTQTRKTCAAMPRTAPAATWAVRAVAIEARSNSGTSPGPRAEFFGGRPTLD